MAKKVLVAGSGEHYHAGCSSRAGKSPLWKRSLLRLLRTLFPWIETLCRPLRTDLRQEYLLGRVDTEHIQALTAHLYTWGFEDMVFAWVDNGQITSLRKMDGLYFQYHVRIFNDGEVRGHYEYTPEAAPLKHLRRVGREARIRELQAFLGDHTVDTRGVHYDTLSTVMQVPLEPSYRT